MTDSTKIIFEKYEIRKTRKQKTEFINWVTQFIESNGYNVKIEKGSFGCRNIVVGDVENAKVIYTAHYDTCAVMPVPNFITPKSITLYILYQVVITALIMLPAALLSLAAYAINEGIAVGVFVAVLYLCMFLVMFGPANKHTANDNTSGVTAVLDIISRIPEKDKDKAAFVLFDLEEAGLIGSSSFASKHRKELKDKLLINFDCVSDGENILFAVNKRAKGYIPKISQAFPSDGHFSVEVLSKGVFYPSDQMNVPLGVGVAALKKSKKLGVLYMDKIHTKKDTVYDEKNIAFLVNGAIRLLELTEE